MIFIDFFTGSTSTASNLQVCAHFNGYMTISTVCHSLQYFQDYRNGTSLTTMVFRPLQGIYIHGIINGESTKQDAPTDDENMIYRRGRRMLLVERGGCRS
uniref:Uncharacterized protein n=2 Tax=Caenorhabditis japonica TaxID=281687 RepID=A0A8R1IP50_CAEJA